MRPIWKGALSFGLVNIPINVYTASEEHALEFDMLHKKDHSPIRYARICKADGKEIPYSDIVKGYEYAKGKYVVLDESDFKHANIKKTSTVEIQAFVSLNEVDPFYFERPYYLEPDKKAEKAYALLREALKEAEKGALVTFVFHNREHLGIVFPYEKVLVLNQIRFSKELRSYKGLNLPAESKGSAKELDVADKLINKMTEKFHPEKFKDTYADDLLATIHAKLKGKKIPKKGKAPSSTAPSDLVSLLKDSLQQSLRAKKKPVHR